MSSKEPGETIEEACPKCHGEMRVKSQGKPPKYLDTVATLTEKYFKIWDFMTKQNGIEFLVESNEQKKSFSKLLDELKEEGFIARMTEEDGSLVLTVKGAPKPEKSDIRINIVLFLATIVTTFLVAGYWFIYDGNFLWSAMFSFSLLTILGVHELGHKLFSWRNEVKTTWPYFLPIPVPLIGTFGAVIKNKTPIPSKEALAEIGASGPLLGLLAAVPITTIGLYFSNPTGAEMFKVSPNPFSAIPTPFLFYLLETAVLGSFHTTLDAHPFAWAGFLGFFVTWLNLLPTGQLDGGHIARSVLSKDRHFMLTRIIGYSLLGLSLLWSGFLILSLLILFLIGNTHDGALDDVSDLGENHKWLVTLTFTVFILCLPIPLWVG